MVKGKKQTLTWISAKREHPKEKELYIVCTKHGLPCEAYYYPKTKQFTKRWGDLIIPIWWMPMPKKPIVN